MLQQSSQQSTYPQKLLRPKRLDIFFHGFKTLKLVGRLHGDRRVSIMRKALFVGSIGGLLVLLLFPDILNEVVLSTVLPIVGTVVGVPIDMGFDWAAFALVVVSLLRFFPAEMVSEHYQQVFNKRMEF